MAISKEKVYQIGTGAGFGTVLFAYMIRHYAPDSVPAEILEILPPFGQSVLWSNAYMAIKGFTSKLESMIVPAFISSVGIATEIGQGLGLVRGTYDPKDIFAYALGGLAAATIGYLNERRNSEFSCEPIGKHEVGVPELS